MPHPMYALSIPMYLDIFCAPLSNTGCEALQLLSEQYIRYANDRGMATLMLTHQYSDDFSGDSARTYKFFGESVSALYDCYRRIHSTLTSYESTSSSTSISTALFPQLVPPDNFELEISTLRLDKFGYAPPCSMVSDGQPIGSRFTHLPSGIYAGCDVYKKPFLNRREAFKMLVSRLIATTNSASERCPSLRLDSYQLTENKLQCLRMTRKSRN